MIRIHLSGEVGIRPQRRPSKGVGGASKGPGRVSEGPLAVGRLEDGQICELCGMDGLTHVRTKILWSVVPVMVIFGAAAQKKK